MEADRFNPKDNPYIRFGLPETEVIRPYDLFDYWTIHEQHQLRAVNRNHLAKIYSLGYPGNTVPISGYVLELARLVEPEDSISRLFEQASSQVHAHHDSIHSLEARQDMDRAVNEIVKRHAVGKKLEEAYDLYITYRNNDIRKLHYNTRNFDEQLPVIINALSELKKTRAVELVLDSNRSAYRQVLKGALIDNPTTLKDVKNVLRVLYYWGTNHEPPAPRDPVESV